ncbi:hypothetical protein [Rhodopirellula halodulae]|uniref:hypothetical protein n=1 Tax=Rhodopirellula halodulae TaxID=2894198 RepID=UPI001E62DB38|nr:hypothetical protein [Rhodopirellula sp. JC737]
MLFAKKFALGLAQVLTVTLLATGMVGCTDDSDTIRRIQTQRQIALQKQSQQDHLGETVSLLSQFMELNEEKASRQISYHLNQWSQANAAKDADGGVPDLASTLTEVVPENVVREEILRGEFRPTDVSVLRDAYLFRQAVQWIDAPIRDDLLLADWLKELPKEIGEDPALQLQTAARLFDWTIRNVAAEPLDSSEGVPPQVPRPQFPFGMKLEGPGYRQTLFQSIWRGRGDALQRANVFTALCQQAGVSAAVLATQSEDDGSLNPWAVGVLAGDEIYLFETELGLPIPGPDQVGIATLSEARKEPTVMRRLDVAGFYDYPLSRTDIQQSVALLNTRMEAMSPRMKKLQSGLTGDRRMTLYMDVDKVAKRWDDVSGIAGVRVWTMPLLADIYQAEARRMVDRDPLFSFWFLSRWAVLEGEDEMAKNLTSGRWQHLTGRFADDEIEGIKGARTRYLEQRAPEFEIEDLRINVDLQKRYGLRRGLGIESQQYDQQLQQIQMFMRLGKRTATHWLALVQYDDGRFETSGNWFGKRVLDEEQMSMWEDSARYSLARTKEHSGNWEEAIELLKDERTVTGHGNRLRARLVDKSFQE